MKRNVPISSEKVIQKMERFLNKNGGYERLSPIELYAFRYAFGSMDILIILILPVRDGTSSTMAIVSLL